MTIAIANKGSTFSNVSAALSNPPRILQFGASSQNQPAQPQSQQLSEAPRPGNRFIRAAYAFGENFMSSQNRAIFGLDMLCLLVGCIPLLHFAWLLMPGLWYGAYKAARIMITGHDASEAPKTMPAAASTPLTGVK